jgi:hypothetical protein
MSRRRRLFVAALAAGLLAVAAPVAGAAQTYEVTTPAELVQAVDDAAGGDTIHVHAGHYLLRATMYPSTGVTLVGDGASTTVLDGQNQLEVLDVGHGGGESLTTIAGVTIEHGFVSSSGAGIHASAPLLLRDDAIVDNSTGSSGGGIRADHALTMDRVLVAGNTAPSGAGGGIELLPGSGTATISNSTIVNNSARDGGGGLDGTVTAGDAVTLLSNTFANNTVTGATATGSDLRVGAASKGPDVNLGFGGTVFAGDPAKANCDLTNMTLADLGGNLDGEAGSCDVAGATDLFANDPKLGPLQDNGGPTDTMLPAADSPLLDADKRRDGVCAGTDQRGVPRPVGAQCDIGAVERTGAPSAAGPTVSRVTATSATVTATADAQFVGGSFAFGYGAGAPGPVTTPPQPLLAGMGPQTVSSTLSGLAPSTTYRVRLLVHTVLGDASSGEVAFSTAPAPPRLSSARVTNKRFRVSRRPTAVSAGTRRPPLGTRFLFTLSSPAQVKIAIAHAAAGLRSGRRCVAPTAKLRRAHARHCTRTISNGTLTRAHLRVGKVSVPFSGRIGRRPLAPRAYTATISAGNVSGSAQPVRLRFTVVR